MEHLKSFFLAIAARVMLIQAKDSPLQPAREQSELFDWVPQMQIVKMSGSHHLHLEGQAEEVAAKAQAFLV